MLGSQVFEMGFISLVLKGEPFSSIGIDGCVFSVKPSSIPVDSASGGTSIGAFQPEREGSGAVNPSVEVGVSLPINVSNYQQYDARKWVLLMEGQVFDEMLVRAIARFGARHLEEVIFPPECNSTKVRMNNLNGLNSEKIRPEMGFKSDHHLFVNLSQKDLDVNSYFLAGANSHSFRVNNLGGSDDRQVFDGLLLRKTTKPGVSIVEQSFYGIFFQKHVSSGMIVNFKVCAVMECDGDGQARLRAMGTGIIATAKQIQEDLFLIVVLGNETYVIRQGKAMANKEWLGSVHLVTFGFIQASSQVPNARLGFYETAAATIVSYPVELQIFEVDGKPMSKQIADPFATGADHMVNAGAQGHFLIAGFWGSTQVVNAAVIALRRTYEEYKDREGGSLLEAPD